MTRRAFLAAVVLSLSSIAASAETIIFEIYALPKDGQQQLLAKGKKDYTLKDVQVYEHRFVGPQHWTKELPIAQQFYIGGSIYREPTLSGFGLWIKRKPEWFEFWSDGGFSWEWFSSRQPNNVYRKLQGKGQVRVAMVQGTGYEEIASVEFLEDVTMRLSDHPWFFFSDRKTHHITIGKGSVLRFAP
jgi:hypothetical protein